MQKIAYPKEQMHRIAYTKLTEAQITSKLGPTPAPKSASPLSTVLAGKSLRIVTDQGPTLSYRFAGNNRLSVAENDGRAIEADYGALTLDHVAFFSHWIPGTQRGYHVAVDQSTGLATVFEVWFSGFTDNREVQREIHFGYVAEAGKAAPEARHALTNRIEGKGFYWRQDNGVETLELYPSTFYSNFVELTRAGGELGFCAPSDYVKLDDELYAYSRVECEFSGVQTLYVVDVNRAEQVGVRLGFDASDALEYYLFTGRGEWVGQLAQFERFGDTAATPMPAPANGQALAKGARRVYRPMRNNWTMSKAEVAALTEKAVFAGASPMAGNKSPVSDFLVGKELTVRFDNGVAVSYAFDEIQKLRWRRDGESAWHEERYESWESTPGVVMFGHLVTGAPNHDCYKIVADFDHGLATCIHGTIGSEYIANEAQAETWFGVIEMEGMTPPQYKRHHYTDELVGRAVTWNYSPGLTSMHLYTTPHSLSWIIFGESGAGGMEWSGPASYVKIRDELYLAYWLEEACNGTLGTILVNLRTMHDCGIGYHCGRDGLRLSAMGAHARHAGRFDIAKYYRLRREVSTMQSKPTRRTFFSHAGAALAAPLAAGAALASESGSGNDLAARLAALEDTNAIRALLQRHAQRVNAGATPAPDTSVRKLTLDTDVSIDFAADDTATAQVACSVDTATPIDGRETLVEMARLQGDGVIKGSERRVLTSSFVKRDGQWQFLNAEFQS